MKAVFFVIVVATLGSVAVVDGKPKRADRYAKLVVEPLTDCICIMYYQCNANFTLNKYGDNIIDIRKDGPCPHYLDVCCKKEDAVPGGVTSPPPFTPQPSEPESSPYPPAPEPTPYPSEPESSPYPPAPEPSPYPPASESSPYPPPDDSTNPPQRPRPTSQDRYQSRGCGYRNVDGVGFRIVGGKNEAQFGEFPWVVAILGGGESYICGGSLIHPQVVLTSAHCVRGKFIESLVARAGEWDRGTTKEVLPHQDRQIDAIIEHEHYHSGGLLNDIALLILREPMELADNIDTICLPSQDYNFDYSQCFASGWGKESFTAVKNNQVILKKVELPVVPKDTCESILRGTRLGPYFQLHESFICAGGKKGQDTCNGDGGSPLMCPLRDHPERYQQAGIVAWGIGCGDVIPGVYASVSRFRDWIDYQLADKGITISTT